MLLGTVDLLGEYDVRHDMPTLRRCERVEDLPPFWTTPWLVVEGDSRLDENGLYSQEPGAWFWVPGKFLSARRLKELPAVFASALAHGITVPPLPEDMEVSVTQRALTDIYAYGCPELTLWAIQHLVPRMRSRR